MTKWTVLDIPRSDFKVALVSVAHGPDAERTQRS